MKIITAFLLVSSVCAGQDSLLYGTLPMMDGKVNYTHIITVDSGSKDQLFVRLKDWAVNAYSSQKAALQSEDKEAGFLAYKGWFKTIFLYQAGIVKGKPYESEIWHTLKFYIKDGKVKVVLTDLEELAHTVAESMFNIVPEKTPIENWTAGLEKLSKKKQDRWKQELTDKASRVNVDARTLLKSIEKHLMKGGSEFDF